MQNVKRKKKKSTANATPDPQVPYEFQYSYLYIFLLYDTKQSAINRAQPPKIQLLPSFLGSQMFNLQIKCPLFIRISNEPKINILFYQYIH